MLSPLPSCNMPSAAKVCDQQSGSGEISQLHGVCTDAAQQEVGCAMSSAKQLRESTDSSVGLIDIEASDAFSFSKPVTFAAAVANCFQPVQQ